MRLYIELTKTVQTNPSKKSLLLRRAGDTPPPPYLRYMHHTLYSLYFHQISKNTISLQHQIFNHKRRFLSILSTHFERFWILSQNQNTTTDLNLQIFITYKHQKRKRILNFFLKEEDKKRCRHQWRMWANPWNRCSRWDKAEVRKERRTHQGYVNKSTI